MPTGGKNPGEGNKKRTLGGRGTETFRFQKSAQEGDIKVPQERGRAAQEGGGLKKKKKIAKKL